MQTRHSKWDWSLFKVPANNPCDLSNESYPHDYVASLVSRMPLVKTPRDLKAVRCVRKYKDKNGDTKYSLRVLFNYVLTSHMAPACTLLFSRRTLTGI